MNKAIMMANLKSRFGLNVVGAEEFNGGVGGIWIRDDICTEATDFYPYAEGTMDDKNVLNRYLSKYGWYAEAYDYETVMVYPA